MTRAATATATASRAGSAAIPNTEFGGLVDCEGTTACNAAPGFDGPSGVGTPNGWACSSPSSPTARRSRRRARSTAGPAASFSGGASSDPYPGGSIASYSWSWGDGDGARQRRLAVAHVRSRRHLHRDAHGDRQLRPDQRLEHEIGRRLSETQAEEEAIAKQHREEEAARRKHEEEATAKDEQEEEAAAERRREEEAAVAKDKQEEEVAKRKQEEEAAAGRKHEEALAVIPTVQLPTTTSGQGVSGFHSSVSVPDARLARTALVASATGV